MNKDNKHNLDPEALFKLLDGKPGDTEGLDDFEKEALEGFAMLEDSGQARDSYQRVLKELSKKNSGREEERRKRPVLWLSIAAALLILFGIGIVWLVDHKEISQENIAMNNSASPPVQMPASPAEEAVPAQAAPPVSNDKSVVTGKPAPDLAQPVNGLRAEPKRNVAVTGASATLQLSDLDKSNFRERDNVAFGESTPLNTEANKWAADDFKKEQETDMLKDQVVLLEQSKEKADKNAEDEKPAVANNNVSFESTASSINEGKASGDIETKSKAKKEEAKGTYNAPITAGYSGAANTTTMPQAGPGKAFEPEGSTALYKGGKAALQAYILKQAQQKSFSALLKGTYEVKATLDASGGLRVISIINTSKDCATCPALLKSVIDQMSGWHSPDPRGAVPTDLQFELTF